MDSQKFIEFVVDSPFNRGTFIPVDRLSSFITANKGRVMYHSMYAFDQSLPLYHQKYGSLKGYQGVQYPFRTIVDIDGEVDELNKTAAIVLEIHQYLTEFFEIDPENIRVWFSGSKGFHIEMPNVFGFESSDSLFGTVKATYQAVFEKWKDSVDLAPTMWSGLIRTPWSYHSSSKLYKVPLTIQTVNKIASSDDPLNILTALANKDNYINQAKILQPMNDDDNGVLKEMIVLKEQIKNYQQENDLDKPNTKVTCMQKLAMRGPIKGQRHQDLLRLASSWRRQGIIFSLARAMMFEWLGLDDNQENSEWLRILRNVYDTGYSYGCKDKVMASLCDSNCMFFKHKDYVLETTGSEELQVRYEQYMKSISSGGGIDLFKAFNFPGSYKIVPGELVAVTGETGVGKTALICDLATRAKLNTLYLNLEMHEMLAYRRFVQCEHGMTKFQIEEALKDGLDLTAGLDWLNILSQQPDISTLENKLTEDLYELVIVDTSDGIRDNSTNNEYTKLGNILNVLREIAQGNNMIIILIHHLKKRDDPNKLITLNDLAGNRANVTKMDHVFAVEGGSGINRTLRSLKVRDASPFNLDFKFDFTTMRYYGQSNDGRYSATAESGGLTGGTSGVQT